VVCGLDRLDPIWGGSSLLGAGRLSDFAYRLKLWPGTQKHKGLNSLVSLTCEKPAYRVLYLVTFKFDGERQALVLHTAFLVIPSTVFLSVRPSLIAVGFGLSLQLLSRGFSFRHDSVEGGRWKREEGEEAGKYMLLIKLRARWNGLPRP
jgi:hypothetical protein